MKAVLSLVLCFALAIVASAAGDRNVPATNLDAVSFHFRQTQQSPPTSWSLGFVGVAKSNAGKFSISGAAVAIDDFKNFLDTKGNPTDFWWAGFAGTTMDKTGSAVGGVGIDWVKHLGKNATFGAFLGVDAQGGSNIGIAGGAHIGISF